MSGTETHPICSTWPLCLQCGIYIKPPAKPWTIVIDGVEHWPIHDRCKNGFSRRLAAYPPDVELARLRALASSSSAIREAASNVVSAYDLGGGMLQAGSRTIAALRAALSSSGASPEREPCCAIPEPHHHCPRCAASCVCAEFYDGDPCYHCGLPDRHQPDDRCLRRWDHETR